jgi:hypothetical protein
MSVGRIDGILCGGALVHVTVSFRAVAVTAMDVKQMHERTRHQKHVRQVVENVGAMLGNQVVRADDGEAAENPEGPWPFHRDPL